MPSPGVVQYPINVIYGPSFCLFKQMISQRRSSRRIGVFYYIYFVGGGASEDLEIGYIRNYQQGAKIVVQPSLDIGRCGGLLV